MLFSGISSYVLVVKKCTIIKCIMSMDGLPDNSHELSLLLPKWNIWNIKHTFKTKLHMIQDILDCESCLFHIFDWGGGEGLLQTLFMIRIMPTSCFSKRGTIGGPCILPPQVGKQFGGNIIFIKMACLDRLSTFPIWSICSSPGQHCHKNKPSETHHNYLLS